MVRLNSVETYFSVMNTETLPPIRLGYLLLVSGSSFRADRKFGADDENGKAPKSRFRIDATYVYAAPQLVARWSESGPAEGVGVAFGYG